MRGSQAEPQAQDFEAATIDEANSWGTSGGNSVEGDRRNNSAQLQRPARRVAGVLDGEKDGDPERNAKYRQRQAKLVPPPFAKRDLYQSTKHYASRFSLLSSLTMRPSSSATHRRQ